MKQKYWVLLIFLLTVLGGSGYMVFKQHTEKEKMIAIAHSEEAKKIYESFMKQRDDKALTDNGIIRRYQIENSSIHDNPMGGIVVKVIINDAPNLYISYNLIKDEDEKLHYANLVVSSELSNKLGESK
ncbi:DUF1310 family protein [Streptococcus pluranimalium]|uniref:DUF1310 domain-containing protein n=1 Tax=Streptococcus pluranimalium TaxID=82348 RepID=A0A345VN18_9STRE|nr:DUF1310 family protein [Streptococcus pluranimalium]AXJ14120.1 hypothetical protein Sp14A_22380 [Streptococcus pluranimalium]